MIILCMNDCKHEHCESTKLVRIKNTQIDEYVIAHIT